MRRTNNTIPPDADPWQRLAAALVIQAVRDIRSPDTLQALDALLWILDGQPDIYLSALGMFPGDILEKAVTHDN